MLHPKMTIANSFHGNQRINYSYSLLVLFLFFSASLACYTKDVCGTFRIVLSVTG